MKIAHKILNGINFFCFPISFVLPLTLLRIQYFKGDYLFVFIFFFFASFYRYLMTELSAIYRLWAKMKQEKLPMNSDRLNAMLVILSLPAVKLVEWISAATAKICSALRSRTNFAQAFQTPSMYGFYVGSIQMHARNWIRRHFLRWDVIKSILRFGPVSHMTDDFWGFWWRRYRWCRASSISPLDQMFRDPKTREPK